VAEGPVADWSFSVDTGVSIGPQEYWPTLDEVPWPELDSAQSLQVLAAALRSETDVALDPLQDFIDDADADGLLDYDLEADIEDPWTALLAMQAEHALAWLSTEGGAIEHARSNQIAEAIVADWPNDPAADYARLHLLQVANDDWSAEHDPEDAVGRVLDLIEYSEDLLVLDVAMSELSRMRSVEMGPETLAQIAAALPEVDLDIQESIAILGMNQTVRQGLWDEATHWSELYRALIEPTCSADAGSTDSLCSAQLQALGAFEARRARDAGVAPTSWRGELSTVVHVCVMERLADGELQRSGSAARATFEVDGTWQDDWIWGDWRPSDGSLEVEPGDLQRLTDCLAVHEWEMTPAEPLRVQLFIHVLPAD